MKLRAISLIVAATAVLFVFVSAYVVDETEQVVVTQFGKLVGEPKTEPGLYFKIPVIQRANYFPKNLLAWDGESGQVPTLDKTFIYVDTFARWKIVDPLKFFQTVNNVVGALSRLDDILDAAVRNLITSYPLIETVRRTNRELDTFETGADQIQEKRPLGEITMGREKIIKGILKQARPKVAQFGIELVDVKIKRLNYVKEVQESVYERMIAERKQMTEKFRAEGKGEALKILGEKERDLKKITSEAYKTAQQIKGNADAEATRIYAEAYGLDPDFYSFSKTLELYNTALDESASLVLSTDSELFKFLKGYEGKE